MDRCKKKAMNVDSSHIIALVGFYVSIYLFRQKPRGYHDTMLTVYFFLNKMKFNT